MTINLDRIPPSEFSEEFLQGMLNRMAVSFHKYGRVEDAVGIDCPESARQRIERYDETGNVEWLMDAANFCMMEFMRPKHPDAHYRATDSDESPGRKTVDGRTALGGRNRPEFHRQGGD